MGAFYRRLEWLHDHRAHTCATETALSEPARRVLRRDLFGSIVLVPTSSRVAAPAWVVERDTRTARWWLRLLARRLAAREARALATLARVPQVPRVTAWDGRCLCRSWLDGAPMHRVQPRDRAYFREALRLLRRMHAAGIVHNDLARESNWLVTPKCQPALVGFQLAMRPRYRGRHFRALAHDDLRHLLGHKRAYCPQALTARQRSILSPRSWPVELWLWAAKPVHLWLTRGLLGWRDREGVGDHGAP
jgi:hypothetical protein